MAESLVSDPDTKLRYPSTQKGDLRRCKTQASGNVAKSRFVWGSTKEADKFLSMLKAAWPQTIEVRSFNPCIIERAMIMSLSILSFLITLFHVSLFPSAFGAHTCYFPDKTTADHDFPCHPDRDISACCGPGYACLADGVCQVTNASIDALNAPPQRQYLRGSCTDRTWSSTACPLFCIGKGCMESSPQLVFFRVAPALI